MQSHPLNKNQQGHSSNAKTTSQPLKQQAQAKQEQPNIPNASEEIGGFDGPEPTRYGDWEKNGRCIDF